MTNETAPTGPTPEAITEMIRTRYPETDIIEAMGATFFSLDPQTHWPNFATIVTTDEHDDGAPSNLTARPEAFRLNLGVSRQTAERIAAASHDVDPASADVPFPHPVYAKQHWVSIVNPSQATLDVVVAPLLAEAHERVARRRDRDRAPA